jgi:iron(III) transport system ATP-binding protein
MSIVELKNISKSFGKTPVLHDLSLTIGEGEFFTLLGPSGCGKTTTLRLLAGFSFPDSGEIIVDGEDIARLPPENRGMGMVFQNYALFPHLNVAENVSFGLRMQKVPKEQADRRVDKYLHMVRLDGYGKRRISELSGGQQQRVALARALAVEPRILLLDEPLSNLDAKLREDMRMELRGIQKQLKMTTVYVTHDQAEALSMSDRVAVFENGFCSQVDVPKRIYDAPANSFIASFVGATTLLPCKALSRYPGGMKVTALGTELDARCSETLDDKDELILSIRPEGLSLCDPGKSTFQGEFIDAVFNGATITITAIVGESIITASILNDEGVILPQKGQSLGLSLKKRGGYVVSKSQGSSNA